MNQTSKTLLEQLKLTDLEINYRFELLGLYPDTLSVLNHCKSIIDHCIDDIALLIGDADTLKRLKVVQKKYISDLFSGFYDCVGDENS